MAGTLLFFSSLAFGVLENAMSVIFAHWHAAHTRLEAASVIILLGAQVIAEYERLLPEFGGDRRESTTRQAGEISGRP
jgi:hypothetical protein